MLIVFGLPQRAPLPVTMLAWLVLWALYLSIINIGGTETVTILELARQVQEQMGIPMPLRASFLPYEALPGKYQDVRHRIPDTTKARELLGFEARVSLADGLARSIEWHHDVRTSDRRVAASA